MAARILGKAVVLCLLLRGIAPAAPAPTFIKFDSLPAGTRVEEQYASQGVHFVNDHAPGIGSWRASPEIAASAAAWSNPHILVNDYSSIEFSNSANVPMVIRFDQPIAGVGMRLARIEGTATQATVTLVDCLGNVRGQRTVALTDNFTSGIQLFDSLERTTLVVIDYGDSTTPEAIDDLAFLPGTGICSDPYPPAVNISSPPDNAHVASSPVRIEGTVLDNSGAVSGLTINGTKVKLTPVTSGAPRPKYEFGYQMDLTEGSNAVTALARDPAGNKGSDSITIHFGTPASVQLSEFHLTQRGIMLKQAYDVDTPFVAGKFTIVRIKIDARTASGGVTYVSAVKMALYREVGGSDVEVNTFWGTLYSPIAATFDSPSDLAGIHFYLPGYQVSTPGKYRMRFQAYAGLTPVGPVLDPPGTNPYFQFDETKTITLYICPTEAPLFDPALGQAHISSVLRTLSFFVRAYPIAEDGLQYVVGSPLPMSDGSKAMKDSYDYIKGEGFEWTFIDDHTSGIFRPPIATHYYTPPPPSTDKVPMGGRFAGTTLANLPNTSGFGLFRPGSPPQWKELRYAPPMDDNHNGVIDDNLAQYIAQFYDMQSSAWMTNLQQFTTGDVFRAFQDQNGSWTHDDGEPEAPIVTRWRNMRDNLLFGPAKQAMNAYNDLLLTGRKMNHAVLWFPEPFHPVTDGWGMLGDGQGDRPGSAAWIRVGPRVPDPKGGDDLDGIYILSHEIGHNFGLDDKYYDGIPKAAYMMYPWQSYVYYKSGGSSSAVSIMYGGWRPDLLFFTSGEYKILHGKLKGSSSSPAAPPHRKFGPKALHVSGVLAPDPATGKDRIVSMSTNVVDAVESTAPEPAGEHFVRIGSGGGLTMELPFEPRRPTRLDFAPDGPMTDWQDARADHYYRAMGTFDLYLPFGNEPDAWVEVAHADEVLRRIDRSPSSPTVRVLQPNGGEPIGPYDEFMIEWEADDPDGDPLTYSVFYSPDAGSRWFPVATGLHGTRYRWNAGSSPGGTECWILVKASDGFNIGEDRSDDVFSVGGKPPVAAILQPTSGSVFVQWQRIPLVAMALDPEQRDLNVTWTLEPDGIVTPTAPLSMLAGPLAPGPHLASLLVEDAQGLIATQEVPFFVEADSDRDGMPDAFEEDSGLDPGYAADAMWDLDEDGLTAFDEAIRRLDPNNPDSDGDGWKDGHEVASGSDPGDPNSRPPDVTPARGWEGYR